MQVSNGEVEPNQNPCGEALDRQGCIFIRAGAWSMDSCYLEGNTNYHQEVALLERNGIICEALNKMGYWGYFDSSIINYYLLV